MSSSRRFIVSISLVYWLIASYNSRSLDALHSLYHSIFSVDTRLPQQKLHSVEQL